MTIYRQWLEACSQCDLPAITTDTAVRLIMMLKAQGIELKTSIL